MAAAMPSSENKGSVWGTSLELLAGDEIRHNPARAQALVQQTSGHSADLVVGGRAASSLRHGTADDLVAVLVEQER
jgi:hypothetical protein